MAFQYPKLSELSQLQLSHLAWRIDHKTGVGYLTACKIARIEMGDAPLDEVLRKCGMTAHQAKIHSRKVINFSLQSK